MIFQHLLASPLVHSMRWPTMASTYLFGNHRVLGDFVTEQRRYTTVAIAQVVGLHLLPLPRRRGTASNLDNLGSMS